jgi:glycosyltransferase involved in cell wall biosynthesis
VSSTNKSLSIILPSKNEEMGLARILPLLSQDFPNAEIIVVNDGSTDNTAEIAASNNAKVITHPYSMGNGAAIKSGARAAKGEIIVFMDADGQHKPDDIQRLLEKLNDGFDMVIGARSASGQASMGRLAANAIYNRLSSWMVGHKIHDLTSGFRAVKADKFKEFLHLLPNGFSYPTTITMSFFRAGYPVTYVPVDVQKRKGESHISIIKDGIRFFLIIFKIGTLYSPLKIFFPLSAIHLFLGLGYYIYTFIYHHRFTNMGALLISASIIIFLFGLLSEQITSLIYMDKKNKP